MKCCQYFLVPKAAWPLSAMFRHSSKPLYLLLPNPSPSSSTTPPSLLLYSDVPVVIATFQWATPLAPERNVSLKNGINDFCSRPKYNQKLLIRFITKTLSFLGKSWSKVVAMALFTGLSNRACFCIRPKNKAFSWKTVVITFDHTYDGYKSY